MESAVGVRFENCHRKYLAVVCSKMGVHWQNWSCWTLIKQTEHVVAQFYPWFRHVLLVFFLTLVIHSYITMTQNKSSSNLEPKHTLLPVSCQHFWPSISFALVLIFLFSRPPHLILLSILANPIFIFNSKISSYNPICFSFSQNYWTLDFPLFQVSF